MNLRSLIALYPNFERKSVQEPPLNITEGFLLVSCAIIRLKHNALPNLQGAAVQFRATLLQITSWAMRKYKIDTVQSQESTIHGQMSLQRPEPTAVLKRQRKFCFGIWTHLFLNWRRDGDNKRNWSLEKYTMKKPCFTFKEPLYCQHILLLEHFLLYRNTLLQRRTLIIQNLGGWKASWKEWISSFSNFVLYRGVPTCWTKAKWEHRKQLCTTTNFQESERSEMFNKISKDGKHLCNRFTSGPQAFRKILHLRSQHEAWRNATCYYPACTIRHSTKQQTQKAAVKWKDNESKLSERRWQGSIKGKIKLGAGEPGSSYELPYE